MCKKWSFEKSGPYCFDSKSTTRWMQLLLKAASKKIVLCSVSEESTTSDRYIDRHDNEMTLYFHRQIVNKSHDSQCEA